MAEIKEINNMEEYEGFISSPGTLNVLKVSASWCGPCRTLAQTIRDLSPEDVEGVLLAEVDADSEWFEDKLAGLRVRGIPALIAFRDGEEKDRLQGAAPKAGLLDFFGRNR